MKPITNSTVLAGIDYSICSPAVAVGPLSSLDFPSCHFLVLNNKKPKLPKLLPPNITIEPHPTYEHEMERFSANADLIVRFCIHHKVEYVFLEDYAMGAKGRVFHIGENGGILKYNLWVNRFPYQVIAPTVIKKFATGKGNADKSAMWNQFYRESNTEMLYEAILGGNKLDSPLTDIVDAWYILKYGAESLRKVL